MQIRKVCVANVTLKYHVVIATWLNVMLDPIIVLTTFLDLQ